MIVNEINNLRKSFKTGRFMSLDEKNYQIEKDGPSRSFKKN